MRSFFGRPGGRAAPGRVVQLPLDQISASPWQARQQFDPLQLQALAESIRQNGLLQPVTVRSTGPAAYQLIAGERRVRAARLAGLKTIPALLAEYEEIQAQVLSLEENLQRQQLAPLEEAGAIRQLLGLWGCTQAEGAARLGLSQSALANKLRLLGLPPAVQALANRHPALTERHLRALLRLDGEALQLKAARQILKGQLTVAAAERLVERMAKGENSPPPPKPRGMVRDVRIFVNTVNRAVELMKSAGIPARMECSEDQGCLNYRVTIPLQNRAAAAPLQPGEREGDPPPGAEEEANGPRKPALAGAPG